MIYAEAIQFLYGLQMFGARPGLERTFQLAALVGNPQEQLRFIHVAGTNGKGSTCAMLETSIAQPGCASWIVYFATPVSFRERIQVNWGIHPRQRGGAAGDRIPALVENSQATSTRRCLKS